MAGRMRIRAKLSEDGVTDVKALMRHPMETGQRKDADGNPIPAHFITEVVATLGDRELVRAHWGASVSQNPTIAFKFTGGKAGDEIVINYVDNKGETGNGKVKIK